MSDGFAWLFPGQGSQSVGMGRDLAAARDEARTVFDTADENLGVSISSLCWNGPEADLAETRNQQPAIVTASVAMHRVLMADRRLPAPDFVAGHSLGEYSALVAAGALDFADALRLVRRRGELMEQHGPGGMIAILGLDEEAVALVAGESTTEVANFNAPGQTTLSGTEEALIVAEMAAKQRGARRVVKLPVHGAFHSSLMRPVAEELAPDIERAAFQEPLAPLVCNVDAEPLRHPDDLRQELVNQIMNSVQWMRVMETLLDSGVTAACEIGPGNVLTGLARRIDRSMKVEPAEQLLAQE